MNVVELIVATDKAVQLIKFYCQNDSCEEGPCYTDGICTIADNYPEN